MAAIGAEQKQAISLKNFRSSLKNGHSRYGHQTARFAPEPTLIVRVLDRSLSAVPVFTRPL